MPCGSERSLIYVCIDITFVKTKIIFYIAQNGFYPFFSSYVCYAGTWKHRSARSCSLTEKSKKLSCNKMHIVWGHKLILFKKYKGWIFLFSFSVNTTVTIAPCWKFTRTLPTWWNHPHHCTLSSNTFKYDITWCPCSHSFCFQFLFAVLHHHSFYRSKRQVVYNALMIMKNSIKHFNATYMTENTNVRIMHIAGNSGASEWFGRKQKSISLNCWSTCCQ